MYIRPRIAIALTAAGVITLTAATALVTTTLATGALADSRSAPAAPRAVALAVSGPAAPGTIFVAITPCRIVDTRLGGGAFGDNVTRTYRVAGSTGFTAQGGNSSGCGIPLGATAIAASFTANSPASDGYVRAWPSAISTEPNATLLNYSDGQQNTAGSIVSITAGVVASLKVRNHHGPVDIAIDVTGYYAPQIYAKVKDSGALESASNRVVSSTRLATGLYQITVDRQTAGCTVTASAWGGTDYYTSASVTSNVAFVYIWDAGGVAQNSYFTVTLTC